jgi:hypothetical protein
VTHPRLPGILASAALLLMAAAAPAAAQSLQPRSPGINLGRFVLFPSLTLEYTDDSNVFYRSEDLPEDLRISSGVFVARPRVMLDLPIGRGNLRWAYSPLYRDYTTSAFDQRERLSHFFDLESSIRIGTRVSLALRDHYVRATIELQEVDQGGELTFGLVPFEVHTPEAEFSIDLAARHGISLIPRYTSVRFIEEEEVSFFNYRKRNLEFRYNYKLDPSTTLYSYYSFEDTDQSREQLLFSDVTVRSRTVGLGWLRTIHRSLTGRLVVGYQSMEFEGGSDRDFSGPVVQAGGSLQLSEVTGLDLTLRRESQQSFFANNNFYVNTQARVLLRQQLGQRTFWHVGGAVQRNAYPEPLAADGSLQPSQGIRRRDSVLNLEIGAGYQPAPTLRLFLGYNFEMRGSNIAQETAGTVIEPFDYEVRRLVFRLEAGWL